MFGIGTHCDKRAEVENGSSSKVDEDSCVVSCLVLFLQIRKRLSIDLQPEIRLKKNNLPDDCAGSYNSPLI